MVTDYFKLCQICLFVKLEDLSDVEHSATYVKQGIGVQTMQNGYRFLAKLILVLWSSMDEMLFTLSSLCLSSAILWLLEPRDGNETLGALKGANIDKLQGTTPTDNLRLKIKKPMKS